MVMLNESQELDFEKELDEVQRSLREITLMIEQSQGELSKLTQRNAAITTHLQQVQGQLDKVHHSLATSSPCPVRVTGEIPSQARDGSTITQQRVSAALRRQKRT